MADPSFAQNQEVIQAYNECISSKDPMLKEEACNRYKQLRNASTSGGTNFQEFAEGGMVEEEYDPDIGSLMDEPIDMDDMEMEDSDDMNLSLIDRAVEVLTEDEVEELSGIIEMHPNLPAMMDSIIMSVEEFEGEGEVEGPGDETSDSIPARLSDGEFVFTAKAVKQIGVDRLYKMMKKAEEDFDSASQGSEEDQEFAMGGFVQRKCK